MESLVSDRKVNENPLKSRLFPYVFEQWLKSEKVPYT
jgi:hypothetical protein